MTRSIFVIAAALSIGLASSAGAVNVTTYHNDNNRSGWNSGETALTQSNVATSSFKLIASTVLDEQVDAQPLLVTGQAISGQGTHDVVYVATENNTVYALDAATGAILKQVNFGSPIPYTMLPGQCSNNGPNVGITSTPVIDVAAQTMYVITDTLESGHEVFRIHALDMSTLADKIPSVVITATGKLSNNSNYTFNAHVSRQRAALLLSKGNVYAGFASYCDVDADQVRGWVLGWKAGTLVPLAANELTNKLATSLNNYFLTAIWMSGSGLAANANGDVFFVTGNSDYSGNSFNATNNIAESVAMVSSDLTLLKSTFTPSNHASLDQGDADFGSGGVMLLPTVQSGRRQTSALAVAAGKDGNMFLLNATNLRRSIASYQIGSCWCTASYFQGHDNVGRVVASGGDVAGIWKVSSNGKGSLSLEHQTPTLSNGQAPGFFTSVSSNGTASGSAIIWAVGKPVNSNPANVTLYAFNADTGAQLFSGVAGTWPNTGGDANIVPTVANGRVYVASNKTISIFGISSGAAAVLPTIARVDMRAKLAVGEHEVFGTVRAISGTMLTVEKRNGNRIFIDASEADKKYRYAEPSLGNALLARGTYDSSGTMHANIVMHAKNSPALWHADR